jgi:GxxExxY protein
MDRIGRMERLAHGELTRQILAACFEVANELGHGFVEAVYWKALLIALLEHGLRAQAEVSLAVSFRGQPVGHFVADIVVEGLGVVELKAVAALAPGHQAQLINYLNASGLDVGLLVSFGRPRLECRGCYGRRAGPATAEPAG